VYQACSKPGAGLPITLGSISFRDGNMIFHQAKEALLPSLISSSVNCFVRLSSYTRRTVLLHQPGRMNQPAQALIYSLKKQFINAPKKRKYPLV
jgi:hypothetical protein